MPQVRCRLDALLAERGMTLVQLSERVGISTVNLSILKNNHAKAIRFSTLDIICKELECTIGKLLTLEPQ
ncbi:helix-turn-helix domain-containing protein [Cryobacterium luteum]|uniref:Transcriptional regulator n=1 Tax=Cryobacterium luteum TaxID=1424661 RepID=A0A1H8M1G8_9MICO|nr:helix-turn-helix domain-containing protein [Cryobacterium luteum]TFB92244.1 transcriptional regulator [Cryobacterium luteum]SEO10986.1 putative transcriptional regulator [Cryobacterium luteum]